MKTIATKTYWKYLFWLGPVLAVMGVSAGVVSDIWEPVPLGLVIAGIVATGLWLLFTAQETNWWGRRSTQTGTNALIATLSVLIILGLVNFLAIRTSTRIDLTESKLFTLAPESQQVVRDLPEPVKVWIFDRSQNPQDRSLLDNYQRQGHNFNFEYVDPQARPGLATQFGVKEFGEVYLEAKKRRQLIQTVSEQERLSEEKLTNGLEKIQTHNVAKVYFLQGHGEHPITGGQGGLSQALGQLGEKQYTTEPLNLTQKPAVPKDATVIVVAGPQQGLFDQEVKALSDYLNQGGSVLLMVDPNTNPQLDSLLRDWGVRLDNLLALDVSGTDLGYGPAVPLVTNYGNHPITRNFGNRISFYRLARPIGITPVAGIKATPLLLTSPYPQSWAKGNLKSNEKLDFNPATDIKGPLTLGAALSRKAEVKSESKQSTATSIPGLQPSLKSASTVADLQKPSPKSASSTKDSQKKSETKPSPQPSPKSASSTKDSQKKSETKPSPQPSPKSASSTKDSQKKSEAKPSPTPSPRASGIASNESDRKPPESRLVVIGDSDFATDGLFDQQLNGDVFLNSVTWLSKQDEQILSIRPKQVKNRRLNLKPEQVSLLGWTSLFTLPLIGFGAAGILWWQRR